MFPWRVPRAEPLAAGGKINIKLLWGSGTGFVISASLKNVDSLHIFILKIFVRPASQGFLTPKVKSLQLVDTKIRAYITERVL